MRARAQWQRHWDVNLMAHVHAANAVLPQMLARGEGYLVQTASAAGLLSQVNAAPYSVTKHAAVGFAEWLSIAHGDAGIRVSCLCPQGVLTPMLLGARGRRALAQLPEGRGGHAARRWPMRCCAAIETETFLILPHPEVLELLATQDGRLRPLAARHAAVARARRQRRRDRPGVTAPLDPPPPGPAGLRARWLRAGTRIRRTRSDAARSDLECRRRACCSAS